MAKGSLQLIPKIIDTLDLAGRLPLVVKGNVIGIPSHELNIDPAQTEGLLVKFDVIIRGTGVVAAAEGAGGTGGSEGSGGVAAVGGADRQRGVEIKGARSCLGHKTFQLSRLLSGTRFEQNAFRIPTFENNRQPPDGGAQWEPY